MKVGGAILFAAAALMFGVAGCGDDDDGGGGGGTQTSTEAGISKAEFIQQADELCTSYRKRIFGLQREIDRAAGDPKRQADLIREVAGEAEDILQGFDELGTPAGDEELFREYKATGRQQIDLIRQAARSLEGGDVKQARTLIQSGQQTGARLRGIAQGYGFKVCGRGEG